MERGYKKEGKKALVEVGYDGLNTVPLLGTLIKAAVRLHKISQQRRVEAFAERLVSGLPVTAKSIRQLENKHADCFGQILQSLLADHEGQKAATYANAFLFILREDLFQSAKPLAEFIVRAVKDLTLYDIRLITEIDAILQLKKDAQTMTSYFRSLELTRNPGGNEYDWQRRLSVQNLVQLGILAKVVEHEPIWSTEHFDVIARVVQGLDFDRRPLKGSS
jgi:hypothetical protein